jgi:transposase
MRGADEQPGSMFSYVSLEDRVPTDHPLRAIRRITDRALERLSPQFGVLYVNFGRPSIPPEKLLRALLLQALYTIRSERQLMEQLDYNLLFRWFVGLGMDDAIWAPSTFSKNRDRLLDGDIAAAFFDAILIHADSERLLSDEHFTVDGTLLESWASQKSFRPRDGDPPASSGGTATGNFHGHRRRNATHQSTTDPDARLYTGRTAEADGARPKRHGSRA